MYNPECPYCGAEQEINHDNGYGTREDETYSQECNECGKEYAYTITYQVAYELTEAPCLNGGEHKLAATYTLPVSHTKMACWYCDARFPPNADQWRKIRNEYYGIDNDVAV